MVICIVGSPNEREEESSLFISARDGYLHIVYQYDHAVQAGQVSTSWGNSTFAKPERFESVCTAVRQHDIGWVESDREVLFNKQKGQPLNFIDIDVRRHVELYEKGYRKVLAEDPYAGLLVGMHWIGLYTSRFGYDPTFTYSIPQEESAFMESLVHDVQKSWTDIKMSLWDRKTPRSLFEEQLWMGYEMVQIMDRLSQFVSLKPTSTTDVEWLGTMRLELKGPTVRMYARGLGNGTVVVEPFPFLDTVETEVICRKIPDIRYRSQEEARRALESAEPERIKWRFVRSG